MSVCLSVGLSVCLFGVFHRLIKTHIGHARDFTWYRGQRPSPARVILSHERVQIHTRKPLQLRDKSRHTFRVRLIVIVRYFNHARRGRALAAISGKVPSVSGVWGVCLFVCLFACLLFCITDRSKWKHADGPKKDHPGLSHSQQIKWNNFYCQPVGQGENKFLI